MCTSEDQWSSVFGDDFKFDAQTQARMEDVKPKIKPSTGDKRSTIVIPKPEKRLSYADLKAEGKLGEAGLRS